MHLRNSVRMFVRAAVARAVTLVPLAVLAAPVLPAQLIRPASHWHSSWITLFHAADDYFARKLDNR